MENKFSQIITQYLHHLGYSGGTIKSECDLSNIDSMFIMRLANANIVTENKMDKSSHQTHIAITGDAIDFFCERNFFEKIENDIVAKVCVNILPTNVDDLLNKQDCVDKSRIRFEKSFVTYGKRTQSQLQLSKRMSENSDLFNLLRKGLYENDLLIFWKEKASKEIYVLGVKECFYSNIIPNYSKQFNSTILFKLNSNGEENEVQKENNCMKLRVFAEKTTDSGTCYLCGCTLKQYMEYLPETYKDNVIQRGIVKNAYLDRMVRTLICNENIPIITLIGEQINVVDEGENLELSQYRILDGLQRTYRIHEIWKSILYFDRLNNKDEFVEMNKLEMSKYLSSLNEKYDINIMLEIIEEYKLNGNLDRFKSSFERNEQWFEVWEELSIEEETEKMLILNAGHKQMDYRHQLELLFLNVLPKLKELVSEKNIVIIRNKEKSDMEYSKNRRKGEFYFSHIISSFISYNKCQPITTNAELISKLQEEKDHSEEMMSFSLIKKIMLFLINFDNELENHFGEVGEKWIAKETVLVGVFAAAGVFENQEDNRDAFAYLLSNVEKLNLNVYDLAKQKNVDINKVNMGNVTKMAVFNAVLDLLKGNTTKIKWENYFGRN